MLWKHNFQEEDKGFLLIDACNAFNEENRTAMMWEVWHECTSGTKFTFNCYYHWATMVIRDGGRSRRHRATDS